MFSECAGFEVKPTPIERVFVNSRELTVVKQSQVGNKLYLNTEV